MNGGWNLYGEQNLQSGSGNSLGTSDNNDNIQKYSQGVQNQASRTNAVQNTANANANTNTAQGMSSGEAGMIAQGAGLAGNMVKSANPNPDPFDDVQGISTIDRNFKYDKQDVADYYTDQSFDESNPYQVYVNQENPYKTDFGSSASRLGGSIASGAQKGSIGGGFGALGGAIAGAISGGFANVITGKKKKEFNELKEREQENFYNQRDQFLKDQMEKNMNQAQMEAIYGRANTGSLYDANSVYSI